MSTVAEGNASRLSNSNGLRLPLLNKGDGRKSAAASGRYYELFGKRAFDLIVASLLLVLLGPLLLLLIGMAAIGGGRPVFAHSRVGLGGRHFNCLKIRTMHHDAAQQLAEILATDPEAAAEWATDHKLTNDPRVTRLGAFLRKSSLDELPQLVNVLRGDMSVVGPRPITDEELVRYGDAKKSYLAIRPGLTGPWQVEGRNDISYDERVALDAGYAATCSLWGDTVIVARTALTVMRLTGK